VLQAMIRLTNNKPCSVVANPHVNLAFTLSAGRECQAALLPLPSAVSSNMVMDGLYEARIKAGLNQVDEPLFRPNFFRTFMAQHSLPIEFLVIFTTALVDRKRGKRAKNQTCFVVYTFQRLFLRFRLLTKIGGRQ